MNNQSSNSSNRTLWIVAGGIGLLLFFGLCVILLVAGSFLFSASSSTTTTSSQPVIVERAQPAALPTAVSAPLVVPSLSGDVDYETAQLVDIYRQWNGSVVNVLVLGSVADQLPSEALPQDTPSDSLFPQGQGSGFVWDMDGHIVTNAHVVEGASQVQVTFSDGTTAIAEVVGEDLDSDLAVIRIDPTGFNLKPVISGNLDEMEVGMRVAAIGNPFGLSGTLTSGIISAIGRSISSLSQFNIPQAIQIDAAINPGNSGGPLFDEKGRVIGVNAQIRSESGSNSGVGFAIPITIVDRVVPALINEGSYEHSYIGISGTTFTPACAADLDLPTTVRGAYVNSVQTGTPAAKAGLRGGSTASNTTLLSICPTESGGDLITAINDSPVSRFDDLLIYLERYTSPGDTVTLTVLRDGETIALDVTLVARPSN